MLFCDSGDALTQSAYLGSCALFSRALAHVLKGSFGPASQQAQLATAGQELTCHRPIIEQRGQNLPRLRPMPRQGPKVHLKDAV